MSSWKRLSGEIVYQNQWMSVHEDQVISPDGRASTYAWVGTPATVLIYAINDDKEVCLSEHERYISGKTSLEIPSVISAGENELAAAKTGFAEIAGFHADHWERLSGEVYPHINFSSSRTTIYIATGLHLARKGESGGASPSVVTWHSWPEIKKMLKNGKVSDGQTITGLALAGLHLDQLK